MRMNFPLSSQNVMQKKVRIIIIKMLNVSTAFTQVLRKVYRPSSLLNSLAEFACLSAVMLNTITSTVAFSTLCFHFTIGRSHDVNAIRPEWILL